MRRAAKVDMSQSEIVKKLRSCGVAVEPRLAMVGQGVPDLLCSHRGVNFLLECKTGTTPSARSLTKMEQDWHDSWPGQVAVVSSWEEAMDIILGVKHGE